MEYQEALKTIGQLVKDGRLAMDYAQQPFAKHVEVDLKTLRTLEKGERAPWDTTLSKVEKALNWRQGSIREVLDHHEIMRPQAITLDYMREGSGEATWADLSAEEEDKLRPVTRAGLLTNEELIGELAYRLRNKNRGMTGAFQP